MKQTSSKHWETWSN